MEKFRIAMYGMSQVTAIVYGVLASSTVVKLGDHLSAQGYHMSGGYYRAMLYRDYGSYLLLVVLAWGLIISWLYFVPSRWAIEERTINVTGIGLTIAFAVLGTVLAFGGAMID